MRATRPLTGDDTMSDPTPIPMFERRRIEATILKHVYDTLKSSHGVDVA